MFFALETWSESFMTLGSILSEGRVRWALSCSWHFLIILVTSQVSSASGGANDSTPYFLEVSSPSLLPLFLSLGLRGVIQWPRNGPRTFYDRVRRFWASSGASPGIRNLLISLMPIQWTYSRIFARTLHFIICPTLRPGNRPSTDIKQENKFP